MVSGGGSRAASAGPNRLQPAKAHGEHWPLGPGVPHVGLTSPFPCLSTDELESVLCNGQRQVRARDGLTRGLAWGPFQGSIKAMASSPGQAELVRSPLPAPGCRPQPNGAGRWGPRKGVLRGDAGKVGATGTGPPLSALGKSQGVPLQQAARTCHPAPMLTVGMWAMRLAEWEGPREGHVPEMSHGCGHQVASGDRGATAQACSVSFGGSA